MLKEMLKRRDNKKNYLENKKKLKNRKSSKKNPRDADYKKKMREN